MDIAKYAEPWRQRAAAEDAELAERSRRAYATANRLARRLGAEFGARRVLLVGSLRRGTFGPGSDIDLAVEGLSGKDIERANLEFSGTDHFEVDVISLEEASPRWRAHLQRWSEPLWPPT